ncbi:gpW family head-tail joining protein [Amorphus orientalis]|uniref:Uncharacterized protein n=1 Tax=Amorphus orientalis TaxID=649198 RepID=A0AAE4AWF4_9HYPH|nr:gpW family head-tail joining protein [Amorphus orientalis]MDQ0317714.1 hypothetical protein [Amorphus orientalis]
MAVPPNCQHLKQKLDEAEAALHDLQTGRAVRVLVDHDGSRIEYQVGNKAQLSAYVSELRKALDACLSGRVKSNGPLRFVW